MSSKRDNLFNKARLDRIVRQVTTKSKEQNSESNRRRKYNFDCVTDHLFSRIRDDQTKTLNDSMFVPRVTTKEPVNRLELAKDKVAKEYLELKGSQIGDTKALYNFCLKSIVLNIDCYDMEALQEVLQTLPPIYLSLFHYYCTAYLMLDDNNYGSTIISPLSTIFFPSSVSGEAICIAAEQLINVGKKFNNNTDWEDLISIELLDLRKGVKEIVFSGTSISVQYLPSITEHFVNLRVLHFIKCCIGGGDCWQWRELPESIQPDNSNNNISSLLTQLKFPNLEELHFVCCSFVDTQFMLSLCDNVFQNFPSLKSVIILTTEEELNETFVRGQLIKRFSERNVLLNLLYK